MKKNIISINYNEKIILEDIFEIRKNLRFFKKNNIPVYFPFSNETLKNKKKIINQINEDGKNSHPENIAAEINKFLARYEKEIIDNLREYDHSFKIRKRYKVFLNYYGCDGYYNFPDTIVINIHDKNTEYMLETLFHELIHLLIFESQKRKGFEETEKIVDKIFIKAGLNFFFQIIRYSSLNSVKRDAEIKFYSEGQYKIARHPRAKAWVLFLP